MHYIIPRDDTHKDIGQGVFNYKHLILAYYHVLLLLYPTM